MAPMGWDVHETSQTCPCGKGKSVREHWSEDWGRQRTEYRLDCEACQAAYVVWVRPPPPSRMHKDSDWAAWITRPDAARLRDLEERLNQTEQVLLEAVRGVFGSELHGMLAGERFKTRQHKLLTAVLGRASPSFGRFDRAVKEDGLAVGLPGLLELGHAPALLERFGDTGGQITSCLRGRDTAAANLQKFEQELRGRACPV